MKRVIAAVFLAAFTVPALALEVGPPYEQTVQDMQLPNVKDPVVTDSASNGATDVTQPVQAGPAQGANSPEATAVWLFIAPAQ
jgi:hypothetical protein